MGKKNIIWNRYFRDKAKFADLFNGVCFHGEDLDTFEDAIRESGLSEDVFRRKIDTLING